MIARIHGSYLLAIIALIAVASAVGWFYDRRAPVTAITSSLEVPDNVDYYLSQVKLRSMNRRGTLHYQLLSPYLEHYIREDISHIEQPEIQFNGMQSGWSIQSKTGTLQHKDERFELQQQVVMLQNNSDDPLKMNTELMILKPRSNLVEIPKFVTVVSSRIDLKAANALLDIDRNYHRFNRVKAIHQPSTTGRTMHEAS